MRFESRKCVKIRLLRPGPLWGNLQHSPRLPSWILARGKEWGREGKGKEGEGKEKEGRSNPPEQKFWLQP